MNFEGPCINSVSISYKKLGASRKCIRLNTKGRKILRNILKQMSAIYSSDRACGKFNIENMMINGTYVKFKENCRHEMFNAQRYKGDVEGFETRMKLLCKDPMPVDVKHLITYMKEQNKWMDWLIYHPATWNDQQSACAYLYLREISLSRILKRQEYNFFRGTLKDVWKEIATQKGDLDPEDGYWKKLVPTKEENEIMYEAFCFMEEKNRNARATKLNSPEGYFLYCRNLLVHYKDSYKNYHGKIDDDSIEPMRFPKIAKNIWAMQPSFLSLLMQKLISPSSRNPYGEMWRGFMLPAVYEFELI